MTDFYDNSDDFTGAAPVAVTAAPSVPRDGVTARTPFNVASPFAGFASFGLGAPRATTSSIDREPDTVTLSGTFGISNAELRKQADKGRALELRFQDGIDRIEYSNPLHAKHANLPKGVNVLKGLIRFHQENNAGAELMMSVNVPAPMKMRDHGSKAIDAHAPNGMLTMKVPNKMVAKVEQHPTPEAEEFLRNFPGQTAEDQDVMVQPVSNDPKTAHVQVVNPSAFAVLHYNAHPEVVKSGKFLAHPEIVNSGKAYVPVDERGRSYADHAIAMEAKEAAQKAIRTGVTHCNLFTDDFVVRVWPPDMKKRVNGATKDVIGHLADVHSESVNKSGVDKLRPEDKAAAEFRISYSITLPFITSSPNFE